MACAQLATLGLAIQLSGLARIIAKSLVSGPVPLVCSAARTTEKMLPTLVRRMAQASKPQIEAAANPSKLKKVWPPDFSKLSPQEQLRFEKRYKRRIAHIAQRPTWTKAIKLTQYFTISRTNPELLAIPTC